MEGQVVGVEERLAAICGSLNVLHGQLVDVVVEVVASGEWAVAGVRSVEHWLCWQAGVGPATARRLVALAQARSSHPQVSAGLSEGALSLDQASAAVAAPAHCDEVMARLARLSTVSQIRLETRVANTTLPPPTVEPAAAAAGTPVEPVERVVPVEEVSWFVDEGGRFVVRAELDAERGRVVEAALVEARDRGFRDGDRDVSWADALVDVAARSLGRCPPGRVDLFRVNVFADVAGPVTWNDASVVPDAVRRRLGCDGAWTPVIVEAGRPVSVGRSLRIVPERTRRLVERRDRGMCRVPWCASRAGLQIHHIVHWEDGGPTDTANLVTICGRFHRHHHRGRLTINGDADRPDGLTIDHTPTTTGSSGAARIRPAPANAPPPRPAEPYRHPLGERLDTWSLDTAFPLPDTG